MVDDGKGAKVEWQVEGRAPGVLLRQWTKTSLMPGEKVTGHEPAKDGTKVGIIARVTKADGTIPSNQPVLQQAEVQSGRKSFCSSARRCGRLH
jgi:hypothetical protein